MDEIAPGTRSTLEVYADVACPFAYVGITAALAERARRGRGDVALRVRAWPLELVNAIPLDPASVAEHVEDLRDQVAPGLFAGFRKEAVPGSSMPALALESAAYRRHAALGEAVSMELRRALFEDGLDPTSAVTLRAIASRFGLGDVDPFDDADVLADWHRGEVLGVRGSPHFFCGSHEAFCPALDIEHDAAGHLVLARNAAQLAAFLRGCFAD